MCRWQHKLELGLRPNPTRIPYTHSNPNPHPNALSYSHLYRSWQSMLAVPLFLRERGGCDTTDPYPNPRPNPNAHPNPRPNAHPNPHSHPLQVVAVHAGAPPSSSEGVVAVIQPIQLVNGDTDIEATTPRPYDASETLMLALNRILSLSLTTIVALTLTARRKSQPNPFSYPLS